MHLTKNERFKSHYDNMVQAIHRYIYYRVGDYALAQDLVQDVFASYWEKIDYVKEGGESPYLYKIAKNLLINRSEKNKVILKFEQSLKQNIDNQGPQFLLEEQEFKVQLEKIIADLPETQREVLLMHRIDGMKYKEIAINLNISQKAVEKRMHQALLKLRTLNKNI